MPSLTKTSGVSSAARHIPLPAPGVGATVAVTSEYNAGGDAGAGSGASMREKYLGDSFDVVKRFWGEHLVCFDQSIHRKHEGGLTRDEQREAKRVFLRSRGIASFYYVSHAPFLFMAEDVGRLRAIRDRLLELGIPEQAAKGIRLEPILA